MRSRFRAWPGVLAVMLLAAGFPAAAQAASDPSGIQAGFDAAWSRHPERRAAALRREAAAASLAASRRWSPEPPSLELSARTDRPARNQGAREYEAAVALPMWLPGERSRAQAVAHAESASLDVRLLAAQWRLAGEVREAYWQLQRAHQEHALAQQRLYNARQLAADVARRVQAGELARADAHQAESAVAAAEVALADGAAALARSAQAWSALTGLAAPPAPGVAEPPVHEGREANESHPALRELATRQAAARHRADLAAVRVRAHPELTIGASRERESFGERHGQAVLVGVRIPLGTSSEGRSTQAAAQADAVEIEAQLEIETRRVHAQVGAAWEQWRILRQAHQAAERRAALARESRGFFEKSFRLGETDLPTRLRVELDAEEAQRQAARSRIDVEAAHSQLRQALGLLPE